MGLLAKLVALTINENPAHHEALPQGALFICANLAKEKSPRGDFLLDRLNLYLCVVLSVSDTSVTVTLSLVAYDCKLWTLFLT